MSISSVLLLLVLASLSLVSVSGASSLQWSFYNATTTCSGPATFTAGSTSTSLQSNGNYSTGCQRGGENTGSYVVECSNSNNQYYWLQYNDNACTALNQTYSSTSGNCDAIPMVNPINSFTVTCSNSANQLTAAIAAPLAAVLLLLVSQLL